MNRYLPKYRLVLLKHANWKTSVLRWVIALLLFLPSLNSVALEMEIKDDHLNVYNSNIEVFKDVDRVYSIDDLPFNKFEKYKKANPNFGLIDGVVWLKFNVSSKEKRKLLLEFRNPSLDKVSLFKKIDNSFIFQGQFGDNFPFSERKIRHRFFQYEIEIPAEIILKIDNLGNKCFIPIQLISKEFSEKQDYKFQFYWGMYFGLLLFIFFLTLTLYVMLRKTSTFYYMCYLVITMIAQISHSGFGAQYFWPNSPFFSDRSLPLTGVLATFFLVLFVRHFLKTKKYSPRFHHYYSIVNVLLITIGIMAILPSKISYHYATMILNVLLVLASLPIFLLSYQAIKRGFKPAKFFLWSISVLSLSVWVFVAHNFGWIPSNEFTSTSLQIGTACEVVLLTLAIIKELKCLKEKASRTLLRINTMKDSESVELAEKLETRTKKIFQNKLEIQEKNEKMVSSMNYARNIQDILIPKELEFIETFADGFVLTQAKDIVSGDFYWCANVTESNTDKKDKLSVFCVGDCTGHGVPGALISVLGLRLLNGSLTEKSVVNASTCLDYLHVEFVKLFQGGEDELFIRDGMDCAVGVYNPKDKTLQFAAAKNSLILVRKGELTIFKGDKQEIGSSAIQSPFSQVEIQLLKGDRIYLFTDGYADQFGGEFNKKMKPAKLKELILENHLRPMADQKSIYQEYFNLWKGDLEQTDDMCLVGLVI